MGRDGADYDAFFRACLPKVLSLARRMTANQAAAEDVAVEALARAFANWDRVSQLPHRQAWVLRVAINLVIGQARRHNLRMPRSSAPPEVADAATVRVALVEALRHLPVRQREAVGAALPGWAGRRGRGPGHGGGAATVRTHAHRGLASLKAEQGDKSEGDGVDLRIT